MKTIGLVGGVASGKSRVGRMLVDLGAGLLDADRIGHEVLNGDVDVQDAIRGRWGDCVFTADGLPDRAAIAQRVFGQGDARAVERQFLESVLHPRIRSRLEAEGRKLAAAGRPAVVLDVPLLLEVGWGAMCDVVLMVDASRETRLARARMRGWTEAHFDEREAVQWPIVKKRSAAHAVIKNDGSEEDLRRSVLGFWNQFVVSGS